MTVAADSPISDTPNPAPAPRLPWHAPVLERLGPWRAATLQQSVPIGPGMFLVAPGSLDPERVV